MRSYNVQDIMQRVRNIIDQNMEDNALVSGEDMDTLELNDVISENLCPGIRLVEMAAPIRMLGAGDDFSSGLMGTQDPMVDGCMVFPLPADYLRLVHFRMASWRYGITEPISMDDARYTMQRSMVEEVRGNAERPVLAEGYGSNGLTIGAYTCDAGDKVTVARYIPEPEVSSSKMVRFPHRLEEAVLYSIASLTENSFGDSAKAQELMSTARIMAGIKESIPQIAQQPVNEEQQ